MANLGRLEGPGRTPIPPGLSACTDAELAETLRARIAALVCALLCVLMGAASFVVPVYGSGAQLVLLCLLTAGGVGAPFAVVGIVRVLREQRDRDRRRREEARLRREQADAVRRRLAKEPVPRSVAEARRDPDAD